MNDERRFIQSRQLTTNWHKISSRSFVSSLTSARKAAMVPVHFAARDFPYRLAAQRESNATRRGLVSICSGCSFAEKRQRSKRHSEGKTLVPNVCQYTRDAKQKINSIRRWLHYLEGRRPSTLDARNNTPRFQEVPMLPQWWLAFHFRVQVRSTSDEVKSLRVRTKIQQENGTDRSRISCVQVSTKFMHLFLN